MTREQIIGLIDELIVCAEAVGHHNCCGASADKELERDTREAKEALLNAVFGQPPAEA
jgi:hypothetical protein